jgi:O-antigen ligase
MREFYKGLIMNKLTFPKLLIYIFLGASIWDEALGINQSLSVSRIIGIVLVGYWLVDLIAFKKKIQVTLLMKQIILFLLFAGLSVLWSENQGVTISRIFTLVQIFLLFMIFPTYIRSAPDFKAIQVVISFFTLIMSLVVIFQYSNDLVSAWQFSGFLRASLSDTIDPNAVAASLVFGFPFALGLILGNNSLSKRLFGLLTSLLIIIGVVITFSRTGFIALSAGLIYVIYSYLRKSKNKFSGLVIIAFLIFGVLWFAGGVGINSSINARLGSLSTLNDPRIEIWKVVITAFKSSPIFGIGLGAFPTSYLTYRDLTPNLLRIWDGLRDPHNIYLQILSETGLIGGILFSAILFTTIKYCLKLINSGFFTFEYPVMLMSALISMCISGIFFPVFFEKIFWLVPILINTAKLVSSNRNPISIIQFVRKPSGLAQGRFLPKKQSIK